MFDCSPARHSGTATHNPEALRYCNRVVLFRDGKIEAEGKPDAVAPRLTVD